MQSQVARHNAAPAMSRGARTARGAVIAAAATLTAAASHSLAGGDITWLSVVATTVLALPLTIAFSGRSIGLWRLIVAVCAAQFIYHWSFAGLGAHALNSDSGTAAPTHAAHLAQAMSFSPALASAASATTLDTVMWVGHAVAAVITIALLHRGDRALRALAGLVRRVVTFARPIALAVPQRARVAPLARVTAISRPEHFSEVSHRGPPRLLTA